MAGENKKVKRYRKKVVELNSKIDFMTNMVMQRDNEITSLKKNIDMLTEMEEEDEQDREGDTESTGDVGDTGEGGRDTEAAETGGA